MNLGRLVVVSGSGRGSAHYNQLTFIATTGKVVQILLTDSELASARERAGKHKNDLCAVRWIDRLAAFKIRLFARLLSFCGCG